MNRPLMKNDLPALAHPWRRQLVSATLLGLSALLVHGAAWSQTARADDYPNRPIRIVVPFSPGGSTDLVARLLAEPLSAAMQQPVIVENKAGAAGSIGADAVAKAPADGYTLLMATTGVMAINSYLYKSLSYNAERDFAPVVYTTLSPNVLVVSAASSITSVPMLIERARAKAGALSFASSGAGSSTHLSGELFRTMIGADIVHVPYKGSAQAIVDVISEQVTMLFDNAASALPFVQRGQLRALAVTGSKRLASMPDLPTVAEAGVPGYESLSWTGIAVPKQTPPAIVARLNQQLDKILAMPDIQRKLEQMGVEAVGGPPERFADHIKAESAKWGKLIETAGIRVQ